MAILVAKTGFGAPRRTLFNVLSTSRARNARARSSRDEFRARARQKVAVTNLAWVDFKIKRKIAGRKGNMLGHRFWRRRFLNLF